jgi:hypothetical protein
MRAAAMYGAGDVRVENVPDARLKEPIDALVVVTRAAICGSDLWPYKKMENSEADRIEPGRVFDWVGALDRVPDGYRAMNDRAAIKAMIEF